MCLLIKLNDGIVCNGEYPHMTLMRNKYPPKYSNLVIKECLKFKDFKYEYDKRINGADDDNGISTSKKEDYINKKQITIDETKVIVYFVLFEKSFDIKGEMHAFEKDDININENNE